MASNWAQIADVQARLTNADPFGVSTNPTATEVQKWLEEAESLIKVELRSAGHSTTVTDPDSVLVLGKYVTDYAAAQVKLAWASATGGISSDGQSLMDDFFRLLARIRDNRVAFGESLSSSGTVSTSTTHVASYQTDNNDGYSISNGDFAPTFTRGEKW